MILTRQKVKEIFGVDFYDGSMIHSRFSYKVFKDKTIPIGNIVAFRAPMEVTTNLIDLEDKVSQDYIWSEDAVNFIYEIPILDNAYGAVALQRLFNTQIANILHYYLQEPIRIEGDDIFILKQFENKGVVQLKGKSSVSIVHVKNGITLGHTAINIHAGPKAPVFAYSTNLTDKQAQDFMNDVINEFYKLSDSLFIASSKIEL